MATRKRGRPRNSGNRQTARADYIISRVVTTMMRLGYTLRTEICPAIASAAREVLRRTDHTERLALGPDRVEQIYETSGFSRPTCRFRKNLSRQQMALKRARHGRGRIFLTEFDFVGSAEIISRFKVSRIDYPRTAARQQMASDCANLLMRRFRKVKTIPSIHMTVDGWDVETLANDLMPWNGGLPTSSEPMTSKQPIWVRCDRRSH